MNTNGNRQSNTIIFDEAWQFFSNKSDKLKETLRNIDAVPNATYVVLDNGVFVFEKLVTLVREQIGDQSCEGIGELAKALVPAAVVSPLEAVELWKIVPEPYELTESPNGFSIRHRPFNSVLPTHYTSITAANLALADLLAGQVQSGSGDYHYRGQAFILCDSVDPALLPARPLVDVDWDTTQPLPGFSFLNNETFEPGYEPVSEAIFDRTQRLESAWRADKHAAAHFAQNHVNDIWANAAEYYFELLNDPTDVVPDHGKSDHQELRELYPELRMMCDGSLYSWYDNFQMDVCFLNGWTPGREDRFLFYLLGKVASRDYDDHTAVEAGQWVAYWLLRGNRIDASLELGAVAIRYDTSLYQQARRVYDAMVFLCYEKKATAPRGRKIMTMMDVFDLGRSRNRKIGATIVSTVQDIVHHPSEE